MKKWDEPPAYRLQTGIYFYVPSTPGELKIDWWRVYRVTYFIGIYQDSFDIGRLDINASSYTLINSIGENINMLGNAIAGKQRNKVNNSHLNLDM